ncbi:MAG: carbohydrate ABC transporter permease [Candidatus Bathyarchaeia archaeon]
MVGRKRIRIITIYTLLSLFSIFAILPILWTFSCAIKTPEEIYTYPPSLFPQNPNLENFYRAFFKEARAGHGTMLTATLNSLRVALPATLVSLASSSLGGYALSRMKGRYKTWLIFSLFFAQLIPSIVLVIPLYIWFTRLRLVNTVIGLILAYQSFLVPISTAFMKDYFDSIPLDLEEAALIDGCSRFGAFIKITLPLASPGIASVAIFSFLQSWGEFILASALIISPNSRTVPLQLMSYIAEYMIDWGGIMAAAIWAMLPVLAFFIIIQKYFITGLVAGAIKG